MRGWGRRILGGLFNQAKAKKITARVTPMPADTIADRFISAGWLMSQMDLAGGNRAYRYVGGRAVTVGLNAMHFKAPVFIGDDVTIYTEIVRQGKTSLTIRIDAYAERREGSAPEKVTEGYFSFVHIDEQGRPKEISNGRPGGLALALPQGAKPSSAEVSDTEPVLRDGQVLSLRTVPFPRDKNHNGDIFGGWVLSQMDLAGSLRARKHAGRAAAPVAIEAMTFHRPLSELDEVSFYTEIIRTGTTSLAVRVESWALRKDLEKYEKVTEGIFTYVAIDENRKPVPIAGQKP